MPSFSLPPDIMGLVRNLTQRVTDLERKITARASAPAPKPSGVPSQGVVFGTSAFSLAAGSSGVGIGTLSVVTSHGAPLATASGGTFTLPPDAGTYLVSVQCFVQEPPATSPGADDMVVLTLSGGDLGWAQLSVHPGHHDGEGAIGCAPYITGSAGATITPKLFYLVGSPTLEVIVTVGVTRMT